MASLAFELGFDWNTYPIQRVRDGVFPLQLALVEGTAPTGVLVSPFDCSAQVGDTLCFRVYDFTDSALDPAPTPQVLQVLFTSAVNHPDAADPPPFSPVKVGDDQLAQLTGTDFKKSSPTSVAFGSTAMGWNVELSLGPDVTFRQDGRFQFRALLTVAIPGEMARFYRTDPEMVIGDDQ